MLSEARNEMLTQTGRGTPMGEVLRRYWHPIAAADQLSRDPVRPVRLMGEDLVLYKDLSGKYGDQTSRRMENFKTASRNPPPASLCGRAESNSSWPGDPALD